MKTFIGTLVARHADEIIARVTARAEHETIKIDGQPYLTRYYIGGQDKAGSLLGSRFEWWRANTREAGEGCQLFLHHFHTSDQGRELHNHPYTGRSLMLKGGYVEERMSIVDYVPTLGTVEGSRYSGVDLEPIYGSVRKQRFLPGDFNTLGLEDFHRTELVDEVNGAWTLFWTGPRVKAWGFLDRTTKVFHPYMSKNDRREGGGPHTRGVRKAPSVGHRERVDGEAEARRAGQSFASLARTPSFACLAGEYGTPPRKLPSLSKELFEATRDSAPTRRFRRVSK